MYYPMQQKENFFTIIEKFEKYIKGEYIKDEEDEKAVGCNCGRFNKGFLHSLNKTLEERMTEQGVICKISNGAGNKFDPQKLNHQHI